MRGYWRFAAVTAAPVIFAAAAHADTTSPSSEAPSWVQNFATGCWACDVLNQIGNTGLSVADQIFQTLSGSLATLLGLIMAVWILIFAGRMFLPFGPGGQVGSAWNEGAKKLLHFALVLAFLQGSQAFWDYVFTPLLSSGMAIAGTIAGLNVTSTAVGSTTPWSIGGATSNSTASSPYCASNTSGTGLAGAQSVMQQIDCPLAGIQSAFAMGMAVGVARIASSPVCPPTSWLDVTAVAKTFHDTLMSPQQILVNLITGLIIIIIYFFGYALFPILLVDVLMRSIIIAAVSPVAIAASLFHPTRRIADRAIWGLVQSGMTMMFAAIVAAIGKAGILGVFSQISVSGPPISDWSSLSTALANPCTSGLYFDFGTPVFYELAGLGIIIVFMMRQAAGMASQFTGVSGGDSSGARAGVAQLVGAAGQMAGQLVGAVIAGKAVGTAAAERLAKSATAPSGNTPTS
jgi:hypothetical protein